MMERPHCLNREACVARTAGKHCPPCTLTAQRKDPAFEKKRAEAFRRRMESDPEFRARHNEASAARLAKWREQPGSIVGASERSRANLAIANRPEVIAKRTAIIRKKLLGWCPAEMIDHYTALRRQHGAVEARKLIEEEIRIKARREVNAIARAMRAKHERQQMEAY